MRGPKPKPKQSNGNLPKAPADLDGDALIEWKRIIKILTPHRVLTEADLAALYVYATSYADYREAMRQIKETGQVGLSQSGVPQKSPWVTAANAAWDRIRPLLAEFGLTPSARARLQMVEPEDSTDDFI
jgi:P27 family predicted phage terminase small subunit